MNIRFFRFFLDEKDIFLFVFLMIIVAARVFSIDLAPFNSDSLLVVALFSIFTRSLVSSIRFSGYFYIMLIGFFLSLFFSPYTVGLYLLISLIWFSRYF